jgi:hypothetical protein
MKERVESRIAAWALLAGVLLVVIAGAGCGHRVGDEKAASAQPSGISWASLLADVTEFRALATEVEKTESARIFSSFQESNKVSLAYLSPRDRGGNHGAFLRVTTTVDGAFATLAEGNGPGAVTWVWSPNPTGTLLLYIDRADEPVMTTPFRDFLDGSFLPIKEPLASVTANGHNLFFPIVHSNYFKMVLWTPAAADLADLSYQVAWRSLPPDAEIHAFDLAQNQCDAALICKLADNLLTISRTTKPTLADSAPTRRTEAYISPGRQIEVFHATGPKAIRAIRFSARSKADLRNLWVEASWDGQPAMRLPLHMLAGVSPEMENSRSLPAAVNGACVTVRWFMPFEKDGRLVCSNASTRTSLIKVDTWTQSINPTNFPLRLYANYRTDASEQPTIEDAIVPFADVHSEGRFAGCVLGVACQSNQTWHAGGPLIWLDNQYKKAWGGTGAGDYFGTARSSTKPFAGLFSGQTFSSGDPARRIVQLHRYHLIDPLPFHGWASFQLDTSEFVRSNVDWSSTLIWYAKPTNNIFAAPRNRRAATNLVAVAAVSTNIPAFVLLPESTHVVAPSAVFTAVAPPRATTTNLPLSTVTTK